MKLKWIWFSMAVGLSANSYSEVAEYTEPRVEGLRMDRCLTWGKACDKQAANHWCIQNRFTKAIYWEIEHNIAEREPTKMLESKQICNHEGCDAFRTIVCYKSS